MSPVDLSLEYAFTHTDRGDDEADYRVRVADAAGVFDEAPLSVVVVSKRGQDGDEVLFECCGVKRSMTVEEVRLARFDVADAVSCGFARLGVRVDPEQVRAALEAVVKA